MVRAILDGRKTQTRRAVNPQPTLETTHWYRDRRSGKWMADGPSEATGGTRQTVRWTDCPYGQPGDRLWVRETWDFRPWNDASHPRRVRLAYGADGLQQELDAPPGWNPMLYPGERWRPSIHMPRWACRLVLEVTDVRVQRLQEIAKDDARAEGIYSWDYQDAEPDPVYGAQLATGYHWSPLTLQSPECGFDSAKDAFAALWDSINARRAPWSANPWAWAITFRRVA